MDSGGGRHGLMGKLISLAEYARRVGCTTSNLNKRARRGTLDGAVKIGRNWCIDEDTRIEDHRVTCGSYIGWRKRGQKLR